MPTAALSGKFGVITSTGVPGDVGDENMNWEANVEADIIEATSFDSAGFREYIEGLKACAGSAVAIGVPPVQGAVDDLTLQVGQDTGDLTISGAAIIGNVNHATPADGKVEYSFDFNYTGAFALGTVP